MIGRGKFLPCWLLSPSAGLLLRCILPHLRRVSSCPPAQSLLPCTHCLHRHHVQMFVMAKLEDIAMKIKAVEGKAERLTLLRAELPRIVFPERFQLPLSPHMVRWRLSARPAAALRPTESDMLRSCCCSCRLCHLLASSCMSISFFSRCLPLPPSLPCHHSACCRWPRACSPTSAAS